MGSYDTCFFERYAHETLKCCLGHEFDDLINRDRPDLQSPDGLTWGIEVTRAMEESKEAAEVLLDYMSGSTPIPEDEGDIEQMVLSGYGYGLNVGRIVSPREKLYWSMALPMKRILESKVSKITSGFYGHFAQNGLYVFCKDDIIEADVIGAMRLVMQLQEFHDHGYDFLYLSEVNALHVCNLKDGINDTFRVSEYEIPAELRRHLYFASLEG